ncbi:pseudouridine synthase [Oceanobacillus sp. CAU 1775]
MRLDKMLSNMGIGTRKEVKEILKKKLVTVNDKIEKNGSKHIDVNNDVIKYKDEVIVYREFIYLMLHKPAGYLSATVDKRDKTVIDLISADYAHFEPFPVGRLDKDTEGLLLLTNDGELAHQLLAPSKDVEKTYYAKVKGKVTEEDVEAFQAGVEIEEGSLTKPGKLEILHSDDISEIELTITEGKFHQVKRMFKAVGKEVIYLKRLQMGEIQLDPSLPIGKYRELNEAELAYCLAMKENAKK